MSLLRAARSGLRSLFQRPVVDQELDDEVAHYLELSVRDKMRQGLTREAAERAARVEFGGIDAAKETVRGGGWEAHVETLWKDLRYGVRGLKRAPAFTAIAIAT